ncbi:hypothetical protein NHX12_006229 [Muraenolepis orangiensis]|uniref:Uncharacterized protein n=1 Tax=Muraenolepis orangiensis TaxID=630683 RepID=A0A9Q0DUD9_9TELE|nr:hypothetical protein NHX12_006229 [Muraenolepis orangiensis]
MNAYTSHNAYDMAELQKSLQPSPAQSVQYCHMRVLHHPVLQLSQTQHHHLYHHQFHHLLHQAQPAPFQAQSQGTLSRINSSTTLPPSLGSSSSCSNYPSSASCSSSVVTAATVAATVVHRDVAPMRLPVQGKARPLTLARHSLSFSSQDLARYLCEIIRDTDQHQEAGPFGSLQVFSTEGGGSPAGSYSSFSSVGLEGGAGGSDAGAVGGAGGGEFKREETLTDWGPCFEKLQALYKRPETSDPWSRTSTLPSIPFPAAKPSPSLCGRNTHTNQMAIKSLNGEEERGESKGEQERYMGGRSPVCS